MRCIKNSATSLDQFHAGIIAEVGDSQIKLDVQRVLPRRSTPYIPRDQRGVVGQSYGSMYCMYLFTLPGMLKAVELEEAPSEAVRRDA